MICKCGLSLEGASEVRLPRILAIFLLMVSAVPTFGREKDVLQYGEGLILNIPYPVSEVTVAVEDVVGSGIIRGTKEYNKDEYVKGAEAVAQTSVFPAWKEPGKVFYKIRREALSPWNFKDSTDVGTLAVRYVVEPQGDKNTVLRIDAIFVEDFRRAVHPSDGSVETNEYKDIREHLEQTQLIKKETAEAEERKREHITKQNFGLDENTELLSTPNPDGGESSSRTNGVSGQNSSLAREASPELRDPNETPEQHLASLRRQVERVVKQPGAPLKSAPFHTASTLTPLNPGTEVLVVIVTPYWFGVETRDGQHGWIPRDQLESLP